ncbi:hypothetical protein M514_12180 [Trichuris suis]|uniref:Uncharacterized protein n=1 Tax=Trichuris suis TaxID=68888 RepID=A0A085LPN8_9BILA|nr:hypothetical protein M513_12180 [Trichuris suis]KFD62226.1 hypothetical protein M514_12180 [Trichuris suis]
MEQRKWFKERSDVRKGIDRVYQVKNRIPEFSGCLPSRVVSGELTKINYSKTSVSAGDTFQG